MKDLTAWGVYFYFIFKGAWEIIGLNNMGGGEA